MKKYIAYFTECEKQKACIPGRIHLAYKDLLLSFDSTACISGRIHLAYKDLLLSFDSNCTSSKFFNSTCNSSKFYLAWMLTWYGRPGILPSSSAKVDNVTKHSASVLQAVESISWRYRHCISCRASSFHCRWVCTPNKSGPHGPKRVYVTFHWGCVWRSVVLNVSQRNMCINLASKRVRVCIAQQVIIWNDPRDIQSHPPF